MSFLVRSGCLVAACLFVACRTGSLAPAPKPSAGPQPPGERDVELEECRARIAAVERQPALPGAPQFEARRAAILGRVPGEALLFVEEPQQPDRGLRDGYVYSTDPDRALSLVSRLRLVDLFDDPIVYLQRGAAIERLERHAGRRPEYRTPSGRAATLRFGDRVATRLADLDPPLHRDLRSLVASTGLDRIRAAHLTRDAIVASMRFGDTWARGLLVSHGAELDLACLDAPAPLRRAIGAWQREQEPRRRALARLRRAIADQVDEAIPFDRPHGETTAERDGQLRPQWQWAYDSRRSAFSHDDHEYPVFDSRGRPLPPQMCVDFVLDSFERASGTWYRPRRETPGRQSGGLDFDALGIANRRGVLAYERFAIEHPELFDHLRWQPEERIPFGQRTRFFEFLTAHADRFAPGDVIAIQGKKGDGLVHQHAILVEDTDPVTGFPYALADQMRRPRRRTWEGIMAEAPRRSLLFRVRPRPALWAALGSQDGASTLGSSVHRTVETGALHRAESAQSSQRQ